MNRYIKRKIRIALSIILIVLIFLMGFVSIVNYSFHSFYIETRVRGFSMLPTINSSVDDPQASGDTILINKKKLGSRNDIVVAKVDWYDNFIIKRLVGTPGDKIQIKDQGDHYDLVVNNVTLYSKVKEGTKTDFVSTGTVGYYGDYLLFLENPEFAQYVETDGNETYIKLDKDEYFLMGDNWGHTFDCIANGPIKSKQIIGKVDLIIEVGENNPLKISWFFMKKLFS